MRISLLAPVVIAAAAIAAPVNATAVLFKFDAAKSSIKVTDNGRACLPFNGCALSANLLTPFADLLIDEGSSASFNFASFAVSRGFGGDSNARIDAVLAFASPDVDPVGTGGTVSYLRLGGFFTPGVVAGSLTWDTPFQSLTASDGTKFSVAFGNLSGVTFGSTAVAPVTISLTSAPAVPEPATWAMMMLGFGLVGAGLRRRRPATVSV